jgi:hypothetical protein
MSAILVIMFFVYQNTHLPSTTLVVTRENKATLFKTEQSYGTEVIVF